MGKVRVLYKKLGFHKGMYIEGGLRLSVCKTEPEPEEGGEEGEAVCVCVRKVRGEVFLSEEILRKAEDQVGHVSVCVCACVCMDLMWMCMCMSVCVCGCVKDVNERQEGRRLTDR